MATTCPQYIREMNELRLREALPTLLGDALLSDRLEFGELTCEIKYQDIKSVCQTLRDHPDTQFDQLIDLCGIDYSTYAVEDNTHAHQSSSHKGSIQTEADQTETDQTKANHKKAKNHSRYAVVYHLLSLNHNFRLRLRTTLDAEKSGGQPSTESVIDIWATANWFEREAFDLLGIMFTGHPDLRRLLTDYGFIGHPFRKDFPLFGQVEMRYDEEQGRVIYQPVTIEERILTPRTIRKDSFVKTAHNGADEASK